jgi:tRNA(adenine34) deaminase
MRWIKRIQAARIRHKLSGQNVEPQPDALMKLAIEAARAAAQFGDVPVGAVLWTGGKIVAAGFNSRELDQTAIGHAEMDVLRQFSRQYQSWRLPTDSIIAVTAEPCLMCTGALLQARVSHVIYGCRDTKNAALRLVEDSISAGKFDHRFEITPSVLEKECAALLSGFFRDRRIQKQTS